MATQSLAGASGSVELDPAVFEAPVKPHLFHAEVRRQLARRRAGTHSTKNRAAVSGGGIKPWRQKGTGRARQGTIRAPQWSGGGVVFGPVPRDYSHELPKKVRRAALRGALSLRRAEGALIVAGSVELGEAKTKRAVELLRGLGLDGSASVLVVIETEQPNLERALRNLRWASVLRVEGLNTYDVLRHDKLVLTRGALDAIHARLAQSAVAQPGPAAAPPSAQASRRSSVRTRTKPDAPAADAKPAARPRSRRAAKDEKP